MTVPCPVPEWPESLEEAGPAEDRSILLRGAVSIGRIRFSVTAVRVDPIRFGPDFRGDRNLSIYAGFDLSELLGVVAELIGEAVPSTVQLETGRYVLWMLPGTEEF
jgi:hypothetical protein